VPVVGAAAAKNSFTLLLLEAPVRSCGKRTISLLLGSDRALMSHLFDSAADLRLRATPENIVADAWELSPERRILLLAALDVHCGQGNVLFSELLKLNYQNLSRLIAALIVWRDLRGATDLPSAVRPQP
jgi:hypothetical protein